MIIDAQHHYHIEGSPLADLSSRLGWMDEHGIDVAVLTNPVPFTSAEKLSQMREYNDEIAAVERERPDRFVACPSVPIFDARAAIEELERVVASNDARAVLFQPYSWRMDYDYLAPVFDKLSDLGLPIFMHPVFDDVPVQKTYGDYAMAAALGFGFNTSVAVSRLILSGLLDSYTRLKFVVPHLGGALPFLLGRLEAIYNPQQYRALRPVADYLDSFYFDIVCYRKDALEFALSVFGAGRLVFGSDYSCPGKNFVRPEMLKDFVASLEIGAEDKEAILGQNLAGLLGIKSTRRLDIKQQ
jgi:aminocarboxymuconate-semialdehyde decarboxylase